VGIIKRLLSRINNGNDDGKIDIQFSIREPSNGILYKKNDIKIRQIEQLNLLHDYITIVSEIIDIPKPIINICINGYDPITFQRVP